MDDGARLRGVLAERCMTYDALACHMDITAPTLRRRSELGLLSQRDIRCIVRTLGLGGRWQEIFFPELIEPPDPYDSYTYPYGYPKKRSDLS